jgi:spermidine synthase
MHIVLQEPEIDGVSMQIGIDEIVVKRRTAAGQELLIAETSAYGRTLFLDGLVQSAEADEPLYHEPLVHPALVLHGGPRRVLVGGTGEGASLREILRHATVEKIVSVDLDPEVVALCKEHLPSWSAGSLDDPRVELRTEDIQATLAAAQGGSTTRSSIITDPVEEGPSLHLWSAPFFEQVRRVMAADGILVVQSGEADPVDLSALRTVRSTLASVFPHVRVLLAMVPSFHCLWGFALAAEAPIVLEPADLEARIAGCSDRCRCTRDGA